MMLHNYPAAVAACCRLLSHHPLTNLDPLVLLHRLSHLHYNTSTLFRPFVQPQQHCLAAVPAHCSGTNPCVRAAHNQPLYSNSITTTSSSCSSSSCVSRRGLTSTTMHATEGQQQPQHMIVLPMPSLSHAMTSGRVSHWLKQAGERCQQYDIIAEVCKLVLVTNMRLHRAVANMGLHTIKVTTDTLVDEAYKVDDFAGSVTLLLESQEDAYLADLLVPEGQEVPIGTPIAVLCEEEGSVQSVAAAARRQLAAITSMYDDEALQRSGLQQHVQLLEWQSYLKESAKKDEGASGSNCGCM